MGQVVTLMPLLQQTIILEDGSQFLNQVGGKAGYTTQTVGGKIGTTTQSTTTSRPAPAGLIQGTLGGATSASFPRGGINTSQPSGYMGGAIEYISSRDGNTVPSNFGFNIPNWDSLSCQQVISETNRLKNLREQKILRPTGANQLLDANIAIGNSIIQNECTTQTPEAPMSSGGDFGITGGFGASGFGASGFGGGDFHQPSGGDYEVLAYDKLGCPIYGYDDNGTPLYGVDLNGNVITDPTVLPCAMKAMKDESPVKQIASDVTFRASLLVLGGIALLAYLAK